MDKKKPLRWILLAAGVLLVAYGGVRLTGYLTEMNRVRQTTAELREAAETAVPAETDVPAGTPAPMPETAAPPPAETAVPEETTAVSAMLPDVEYPNGYNLVPKIQELRKKSEYIIGWITMDDLDEPVVLKDNEFFLNHDATGKRNSNGAIFMDEETHLLTRPYTFLLYGHNMKSGMMFENLRKYEDPTYCRKHRTFRFDTLYEEGQYEIFAVVTISVTPGKARYLNLWALQSTDRETRKDALASLKRANSYVSTAEVSEEDQILLLVTCVGDDDERLVVAAVRMKD